MFFRFISRFIEGRLLIDKGVFLGLLYSRIYSMRDGRGIFGICFVKVKGGGEDVVILLRRFRRI